LCAAILNLGTHAGRSFFRKRSKASSKLAQNPSSPTRAPRVAGPARGSSPKRKRRPPSRDAKAIQPGGHFANPILGTRLEFRQLERTFGFFCVSKK